MMKFTFALFTMAALLASAGLAAERVGWVTDQKCANAGKAASAEHAKCAQGCVKNGEPVVFLDEVSGRVVKVKNPDKVSEFVGKKVTIIGELVGGAEVEISSVRADD